MLWSSGITRVRECLKCFGSAISEKIYEEVEWKVANVCDKNEFGRVLKVPTALGDHHASGVGPYTLTPHRDARMG